MPRKVHRSLGLGALPPCFPSTPLLRGLHKLDQVFQLPFLREVHQSSSIHSYVVQGGTPLLLRQDSGVEYRLAKICITPNPSGPQWASFPYQFSRNWNIKRGKTFPRSISLLPLPRLLPPVIPLWKFSA